jgi:zinc transporter ZupT
MKAGSSFQKKRPSWPVFFLGYIPAAVGGILLFTPLLQLQPQLQTEDLSGPGKNYKNFLCHLEQEAPYRAQAVPEIFP